MVREMIEVDNLNHPGQFSRVDAETYRAARDAMLDLLPVAGPGVTQRQMSQAMRGALSSQKFPASSTGEWMTSIQLDLEAKGLVVRDKGKSLRWRKA